MNQTAWIALIVVGLLIIVGIVLYLVLGRKSSSSTAVLIPVFPPNGYKPNGYNPNGYNPNLPPGPGSYPNGYNPSLPPGPGPAPAPLPPNGYNPSLPPGPGPVPAHLPPNGYNPSLPPGPHTTGYTPNHTLLPGVTKKDLSEAFSPAL